MFSQLSVGKAAGRERKANKPYSSAAGVSKAQSGNTAIVYDSGPKELIFPGKL